ncbi:MAG: hypothetical protein JRF41_05440 [Deltaproteobacteria bacterium]|nr:hypothetical protein [Deltaproteobacteria bacterium]MBW2052448.1 hypothetical protein [Deltaproteobacteria bacterium]MBW2322956.1 hypothetical protein [Deltaproteobacteria bacterium]
MMVLGVDRPRYTKSENITRDLCKTSNFVEIAEGEKLTRRNITKYFEDLTLSLTYAAAASAKRRSIPLQHERSGAHEVS